MSTVELPQANSAIVMAGIPALNAALYHRIRFVVGDPAACIDFQTGDSTSSLLLLRDIEMQRARQHARVDAVACPAEFPPANGLSGDRETATAQALAEALRRAGVRQAISDRSLPLIYADHIRQAGIALTCDLDLGVSDRRAKDAQEVQWLREAQAITEGAMRMACELVAKAPVSADGVLMHDGAPLTSQRVRAAIDGWLLQRDYTNPTSIVAGGPTGADCHNHGDGELRTGEPVIIDIFPQCRKTRYNGDCTRTVVHGEISIELQKMHEAVLAAKAAATAATRSGVTGEDVHRATTAMIIQHGYQVGLPDGDSPDNYCALTHGTGHGIGLEVHEPPLLDLKGPELVVGDALTIEPGLYCVAIGGVRVEDMVIVTADGCENLNELPQGLTWG